MVRKLTPEAYAPFGWVIGAESAAPDDVFDFETMAFSRQHDFDPGEGGEMSCLWVNAKPRDLVLARLESHRLTEQALLPINGDAMIHVVCPPPEDLSSDSVAPDLAELQAFYLDGSSGVCMRRGTWHEHFAVGEGSTYFLMSRSSSTEDVLKFRIEGGGLKETTIAQVVPSRRLEFALDE
jgi:ureidoglycolate lyase